MSSPGDTSIAFQSLHDSPLLRIRDYDCRASQGGPGAEEESEFHTIVLVRNGAFCRHVGRQSVTSDVNQAAFFPKGLVYRVSHPQDGGDRGTTFKVSPRALHDIVRELAPNLEECYKALFPFLSGPCSTAIFWQHRALVQRLWKGGAQSIEPFWVEETTLQLVADLLEAAFLSQGLSYGSHRVETTRDHAALVEAIKARLVRGLGERLTLSDLASAVHASPFHLARIFQRHTGTTIHRYLTLLRLRTSLERLDGGHEDLTALALDLGFSSHSHFTDTFCQVFGCPPSEVRKGSVLREMSKNLEV